MKLRPLIPLVLACALAQAEPPAPSIVGPAPVRLTAAAPTQTGNVPAAAAAAAPGAFFLANDLEGKSDIGLTFDRSTLRQQKTALARLQFSVAAIVVRDHFMSGPGHLGAVHVYFRPDDGSAPVLAGSTILPPRSTRVTDVIVDVTPAVARFLASSGSSRLSFELRLGGGPGYGPLYRLSGPPPFLEVFPPNSPEDAKVAAERVLPVQSGPTVYREPCLLMTEARGAEVAARLLYPAAHVNEVIRDSDGLRLEEGRDWVLRDGVVVFPAGTRAPVQFGPEFFAPPPPQPGTSPTPSGQRRPVRLEALDETWYRARQVEITYDPARRDWAWPAPISTLAALPRLAAAYAAHRAIKIVHFGDSIAFGHNATSIAGVPPYQPIWGELVAREIARRKQVQVIYLNHSHSGGTSQWGAQCAAGLVGAEKPDLVMLAFGMNDRAPKRLADYRSNMEKIIDSIRSVSPDTEFLVVSTMMNNPAQPGGSGPVLAIRDLTLRLARPGVAFADVTGVERAMLEHKNYLDLSGNGANHPNDFLIGIYAQTVLAVLAP